MAWRKDFFTDASFTDAWAVMADPWRLALAEAWVSANREHPWLGAEVGSFGSYHAI